MSEVPLYTYPLSGQGVTFEPQKDVGSCARPRVGAYRGSLEIKDTHRPEEGPMLLGIDPP